MFKKDTDIAMVGLAVMAILLGVSMSAILLTVTYLAATEGLCGV